MEISKRILVLTFLVVTTSAFSMSSYANELPRAVVCAQMEEAADRLLSGQSDDFYFVSVGRMEFPVPSFFLVEAMMRTVEGETKILASPSIMNTRAAEIRKAANTCDWSMHASVGPFEQLYANSGGEEEFRKMEKASYQAGPLKVSLLEQEELGDVKLVAAYDDTGFIVFFTEHPERAYWLIRLARKLNESNQ